MCCISLERKAALKFHKTALKNNSSNRQHRIKITSQLGQLLVSTVEIGKNFGSLVEELPHLGFLNSQNSANEDKKYKAIFIFRAKFQRLFSTLSQFRLGQAFPGQVRLGQVSLKIGSKIGNKNRSVFLVFIYPKF